MTKYFEDQKKLLDAELKDKDDDLPEKYAQYFQAIFWILYLRRSLELDQVWRSGV